MGGAGSPSNTVAWAQAYLRTKFHLDLSNRYRQTDMTDRQTETGQTTVRSDITDAGADLHRSCTPANWQGTCRRCMVTVPARTSTLPAATCVVKRFRGNSACIGMWTTSTTSWPTGQVASTHTMTITQPHLTTQFALHPSTPARFGYPSPSVAACGATCEHVVSSQVPRPPHCCHHHRCSAVRGPVGGVVLCRTVSRTETRV